MAKVSSERQAEYRVRHFKDVDGGLQRLNTVVSVSAKAQLERLASCYGVTQRKMIEILLADAERRLLETLPASEQSRYYDQALTLPDNDSEVTR